LPTFYTDFSNILYKQKNVLWWVLGHMQKTGNLFLTKIGGACTLKNRDLGHPSVNDNG